MDTFSLIRSIDKDHNEANLFMKELVTGNGNSTRPIVLFGAGCMGAFYVQLMKQKLMKLNVSVPFLFCDNNSSKWGTIFEDIVIISFDEYKEKYNDCYIIITSIDYYEVLLQQLRDNQLEHKLIGGVFSFFHNVYDDYFNVIQKKKDVFEQVYRSLADDYSRKVFLERINFCITADHRYLIPLRSKSPQYFDPDIISFGAEEIFVDGGAFTGDTVEEFLIQTQGKFKKVYSFEPDEAKQKIFLGKHSASANVELYPYGLWSEDAILSFRVDTNGASCIVDNSTVKVPVTLIDHVLQGDPVTFIKMDIEGAEMEALKGARHSIQKYKPKLAICVYHKPLDIVDIPIYLKQLVPEYKIYIRHYGIDLYETVCYAVVE